MSILLLLSTLACEEAVLTLVPNCYMYRSRFLVVGHEHEHEQREKVFKTTSWHTYLHYFMLFNTTSPYDLVARSPPFCFSESQNKKCDLIQFVSSLTWASADEIRHTHHDIIVGYGINDCEGALVRLPLHRILEYTVGCGLKWRIQAASNYISHSFQLQTQIQLGDIVSPHVDV